MLVALPGHAFAKDYRLPTAEVEVVVADDGSLLVTEQITFAFSGSFSGAYRDVAVRTGERVTDIAVAEGQTGYSPGAPTELGSSGTPGTFGVEDLGNRFRIVWHYRASDEVRTFSITYRLIGLTVAYDDVADVYLQVWGDEWKVGLDHLESHLTLPGAGAPGDVLVWGHPDSVEGSTTLGTDGRSPALAADGIPSRQWVEFRVVFPADWLTSTGGATVKSGSGLAGILAEEEAYAARGDTERRGTRNSLLIVVIAAGLLPLFVAGAYLRHGREPKVDYDLRYEQSPPTALAPALVGSLLRQGGSDEADFVATMFDFIRRGVLTAQPTTVEQRTWGGLRREQISDLLVGLGPDPGGLRDFERSVLTVLKRVLGDGPTPLTEFRKAIREDAAANAKTYQVFEKRTRAALVGDRLLDQDGLKASYWLTGLSIAFGVFGWFVVTPILTGLSEGLQPDLLRAGFAVIGGLGATLGALAGPMRRLWVRRTRAGALEAARWSAFKRYLQDFSRLEEAPPIAIGLWEEYLVYAIAFGVADDVLEAARLRAPEALESESHLYWYGSHGYGGHSSNAISGIERALSGAFAAPS
ncbi:MAG: DUF2207 domain-containing protein, partial [Actinobacteria bacterium]|nr:DUF2207 domain-containing protein [Actinomycetota bacterium]